MKTLKNYKDFLLENNIDDTNIDDFNFFLDKIINLPTHEILEMRDEFNKIAESLNENLFTFLSKLKIKYNKWFDDKLFEFLINRKKSFYSQLAEKLNLFDIYDLDDVQKHFPGFKISAMYLAGGMDEAEDTGAGWRTKLEKEFELNNPGKASDEVSEIKLDGKMIKPAYVVNGIFLDMVLADKSNLKYFDKPALFNPVRKEVDRNKDDQFDKNIGNMKSKDFDPTQNKEPYTFFQKTFSDSIEPDDEHLLRMSDVVFLGYDKTAGAGTFGELELTSLIRKPVFVWLVNGYENDLGKFKLWNIPHLSKIARNTNEMKILVKTIKQYT